MKLRPTNFAAEDQPIKPATLDLRQNISSLASNHDLTHRSIRFTEPQENSLQKDGHGDFSPSTLRTLDKSKVSERYLNEEGFQKNGYLQNNSRIANKKYEYGDEGIKVTEEVVQKYKASNYVIQRDIIQKFKKEAQEFRRNRRPKNKYSSPYNGRESSSLWRKQDTSGQNISFIQQQHEENMKRYQYQLQVLRRNRAIEEEQKRIKEMEDRRLREKERRKQLRKAGYVKREKENLVYVGNMLREINHKIKENSDQITNNLKKLRDELNKNKRPRPRPIILRNDRFFEDEVDFQNLADSEFTSQKAVRNRLPVILYNDRYAYSKSYVSDNKAIERIDRSNCKRSADNMKSVIDILKRNERRIEILSSLKPDVDN